MTIYTFWGVPEGEHTEKGTHRDEVKPKLPKFEERPRHCKNKRLNISKKEKPKENHN